MFHTIKIKIVTILLPSFVFYLCIKKMRENLYLLESVVFIEPKRFISGANDGI